MNADVALLDDLPLLQRLALSYAPASARGPTLGLLALDTRLAAILRAAREPMLAQLRLAWWREQLGADPASWPAGEPLLAVLRCWGERHGTLVGLVDGWEALTAPAPLGAAALESLAVARGRAFAGLAELVGAPQDADAALRMGTDWALADLAGHLGQPEEKRIAQELTKARDWRRGRLSRRMRPLAVLHGLAARGALGERSPAVLLAVLRIGLLGR